MEVGPVQVGLFKFSLSLSLLGLLITHYAVHLPRTNYGALYRYHDISRLSFSRWPTARCHGHLQTLADLIDCWPPKDGRIFWGDKPLNNGTYHAGTSDIKLPPVQLLGYLYS